MTSIIKNPIVLALIISVITFVALSYFLNDKKEKLRHKKRKEKSKYSDYFCFKESNVIISVFVGIIAWYILSSYLSEPSGTSPPIITENVLGGSESSNKISGNKQTKPNNNKGSENSEETVRSFNLIGSGLNIPKSELLPKVLIDFDNRE
jgi:hypothetical protein